MAVSGVVAVDRCGDSLFGGVGGVKLQLRGPNAPTIGIQMTANEQIKEFERVGYVGAISEIRKQGNRPLSARRLNYYQFNAIRTGSPIRALALAKLKGSPLNDVALLLLVDRCLELNNPIDALFAAEHVDLPPELRKRLITSLIRSGHVKDRHEALEALAECKRDN